MIDARRASNASIRGPALAVNEISRQLATDHGARAFATQRAVFFGLNACERGRCTYRTPNLRARPGRFVTESLTPDRRISTRWHLRRTRFPGG